MCLDSLNYMSDMMIGLMLQLILVLAALSGAYISDASIVMRQ